MTVSPTARLGGTVLSNQTVMLGGLAVPGWRVVTMKASAPMPPHAVVCSRSQSTGYDCKPEQQQAAAVS